MKKALPIAALLFIAMTGTALADDKYDVVISKASAKVGAEAVVSVKVATKGSYHINKDYPTKLLLTAPEGVTLKKEKLVAADATIAEKELTFNVALTAASAGKKTITGELKGAVCTETECKPYVEKVAIVVDAK